MPTRTKNGISKYAQNTKIKPAIIKKPIILIKPIPNLKKSQIRKMVNKSESISNTPIIYADIVLRKLAEKLTKKMT